MRGYIGVLALAVLGNALGLGEGLRGVDIRDLQPRDANLQDIYRKLEGDGKLEWKDDGQGKGGQLAQVSDAAMRKAKREIDTEYEERRRDLLARTSSTDMTQVLKRANSGSNQIDESGGTQHKAKWYCSSPGSLGFTILRTIGSIMSCRVLDEFITATQTGNWIWRSPPTADPAPGANAKRMEWEDYFMLEKRVGTRKRLIVAFNKHVGISIKAGMCTGMLGWIVNAVACPSDSGATAGGAVSIRANKPGSWTDGDEVARMEAWAEEAA